MSTDLTIDNSWCPFLTENNSSNTFNKFIGVITELDLSNPVQWSKYKNYTNQVVVQTPNYFYKLYQHDLQAGEFYCEIREKLAEIYREEFGIHWEVLTIKDNNCYYQIEQREKLEVCTPQKISFEDILIKWSKTLSLLEEKLDFKRLTVQLVEYIPNLRKLKLVRDCLNKHEDYGIKGEHIFLLDDADWFIALIDNKNNWISHNFNVYNVLNNNKDRLFAPNDFYEADPTGYTGMGIKKWSLFNNSSNIDASKIVPNLICMREKSIQDNIRVLCDGNVNNINNSLYVQMDSNPLYSMKLII